MLIIDGFLENGVFVPKTPLSGITGRQKAVLSIKTPEEGQKRRNAWKEFSKAIQDSDEVLTGEPERIRLRVPEELEAL